MTQKEEDERVREFARRALGGRQVSRDAWIAACVVAESAMKAAARVTPNESIETAMRAILMDVDLRLVKRSQLDELMAALSMFGMHNEFPTDSSALKRAKRAFAAIRNEGEIRLRVPENLRSDGLPMPEKSDGE